MGTVEAAPDTQQPYIAAGWKQKNRLTSEPAKRKMGTTERKRRNSATT
jgi:hypothetical protein